MKHFWDERYGSETYVYGKAPNGYFSSLLEKASPGRMLLPGEGEGRNAVHAASKGWLVDAFDQSAAGRQKAISLAREMKVQISYETCQIEDFSFKTNHYDCAALIYFHVSEPARKQLHQLVSQALKPGGVLILEAFHKEQLNYDTGGPKEESMLYNESLLRADFAALEKLKIEKQKITLDEGPFHQGDALVIRLSGIKPE